MKIKRKKKTVYFPCAVSGNFPSTETVKAYRFYLPWINFSRCYECGKIDGWVITKRGFFLKDITVIDYTYKIKSK